MPQPRILTLTVPLTAAQVERNLDLFTFAEAVKHSATILNSLKFNQLWIITIGYLEYKFAGLETARFLFGRKKTMQATLYFKSHFGYIVYAI